MLEKKLGVGMYCYYYYYCCYPYSIPLLFVFLYRSSSHTKPAAIRKRGDLEEGEKEKKYLAHVVPGTGRMPFGIPSPFFGVP